MHKASLCTCPFTELGLTIIELLWAMAVMSIVSSIAWVSYITYIDGAEYAKAEVSLRNARPALELGEQQVAGDYSLGFTFSDYGPGAVEGDLTSILPGYTISPDVRVGISYTACEPGGSGAVVNTHIRSVPCKSGRYISWTKLCSGASFFMHNVEHSPDCSA